MRYITIGSGTAIPQRERSAPCHLIQAGDCAIAVDLGPGSVWGLVRQGQVSPMDIDIILFTHLHMDHCADLAPFLFALRSPEFARTSPLHIFGPPGIREYYLKLQEIWEHRVEPDGFDLTIEERPPEACPVRGCRLDAVQTLHSVHNFAWRIDPDGGCCGLVITGDGQPTDELIELACSAKHVLVAESAAAPGEYVQGHMNPAQAGELARKCGSRKLVLNHINPGAEVEAIMKEAMGQFDGEVIVAEDGLEIEIG